MSKLQQLVLDSPRIAIVNEDNIGERDPRFIRELRWLACSQLVYMCCWVELSIASVVEELIFKNKGNMAISGTIWENVPEEQSSFHWQKRCALHLTAYKSTGQTSCPYLFGAFRPNRFGLLQVSEHTQ